MRLFIVILALLIACAGRAADQKVTDLTQSTSGTNTSLLYMVTGSTDYSINLSNLLDSVMGFRNWTAASQANLSSASNTLRTDISNLQGVTNALHDIPGGNSGAIQFNQGGSFDGTNLFIFDRTNGYVSIGTGQRPEFVLQVSNSASTGIIVERGFSGHQRMGVRPTAIGTEFTSGEPQWFLTVNGTNTIWMKHRLIELFGDVKFPFLSSNSIIYTDGVTNAAAVTIGSGLTFSGGTLSATGGGGVSTNANQFGAAGATLTIKSGAYITNLQSFSTNFVGTLALPNVATNSILMTGGGSNVVAATVGPGLTFNSGVLAADGVLTNIVGLSSTVFTNVPLGGTNISVRTTGGTNFIDTTGQLNNWASYSTNVWNPRQGGDAVLTNLVGTVANNVTNENSTALQINSGTLTLTPGVLSNLVQTTIDFPAANIISNLNAAKFQLHRNSTITMSNLVWSLNTNTHEVIGQTNLVLTNIVGAADSIVVESKVYVRPSGVNMTLAYPAFASPTNGYYWRTNANSPMWTTATNGKTYVIAMTAIGTNLFSTITEWP